MPLFSHVRDMNFSACGLVRVELSVQITLGRASRRPCFLPFSICYLFERKVLILLRWTLL